MIILLLLKVLFAKPVFKEGDRVNHQTMSTLKTDGYVLGQTANGVLVEWPKGGKSWVSAKELSLIG